MEEVRGRVSFYSDMGMNEKDFGTMVFDCSKEFGQFTLEEMHNKINFLKEFGLSHEDVGRLLEFNQQLMREIREKMAEVGVTDKQNGTGSRTLEVVEDFASENTIYIELRTTPKVQLALDMRDLGIVGIDLSGNPLKCLQLEDMKVQLEDMKVLGKYNIWDLQLGVCLLVIVSYHLFNFLGHDRLMLCKRSMHGTKLIKIYQWSLLLQLL